MKHDAITAVPTSLGVRYVLIPRFCEAVGYTEKAVRRKIEDGVWVQGKHFRKAPDGHIMIDLENYTKWVEGESWLVVQRAAA